MSSDSGAPRFFRRGADAKKKSAVAGFGDRGEKEGRVLQCADVLPLDFPDAVIAGIEHLYAVPLFALSLASRIVFAPRDDASR